MSDSTPQPWQGVAHPRELTEANYERAAERLGCEIAAIKAVWEVEAGGRHFRPDDSVIRRFEPHHFPRQHWDAIGFWVQAGEAPWRASLRLSDEEMFQKAVRRDCVAAMIASSWGAPQIMGFNAEAAGFESAQAMVEHMAIGAGHQLGAFVQLIEAWGLATTLRAHNWTAFAARYNGSGQVPRYAGLIEAAYRKHSGGARSPEVLHVGARGEAVRRLQEALDITVDSSFGPATHDAVVAFQRERGLVEDGIVGAVTWRAIQEAAAAGELAREVTRVEPVTQTTSVDQTINTTRNVIGVVGVGVTTFAGLGDVIPESALGIVAVIGVGAIAIAGLLWAFKKIWK